MLATLARYERIDDYYTKQTVVRILDSDNEEDAIEIEKNKKNLKTGKGGTTSDSANPKIKKKHRQL